MNDLHEKDQIVDLVVVTSMAKTNAEKMKEWREKQRLKDRQSSQKYYETHTEAVLERKKRKRKERKAADETDKVGELVKKFSLLKIQYCAKVMQTIIDEYRALFSRFIADISAKHHMDCRTLKR